MREITECTKVVLRNRFPKKSREEGIKQNVAGYVLDKVIGRGAFANVYMCHKPYARRKFAVKCVQVENDIKLKIETENEIEILKDLKGHDLVVSFVDLTRDPGKINIVLEYVAGKSFLQGVLAWPDFNELSAKQVVKQILQALQFCHSKRIVHRDVCPENIMWSDIPSKNFPNRKPKLKLIDFNLSRRIPEHVDYLCADALGNPSYMAPECLQETPIVTFGSDIWSAGVILFVLLGGYPPFWNKNYNHLLQNIMEANYITPSHLWEEVSSDGKDLIRKILSEDHKFRNEAEAFLEHPWFEAVEEPLPPALKSQHRLSAFLMNLEEEKKGNRNRRYTLQMEERKPFVPGDEICYNGSVDKALQDKKTVDTSNRRVTCHW